MRPSRIGPHAPGGYYPAQPLSGSVSQPTVPCTGVLTYLFVDSETPLHTCTQYSWTFSTDLAFGLGGIPGRLVTSPTIMFPIQALRQDRHTLQWPTGWQTGWVVGPWLASRGLPGPSYVQERREQPDWPAVQWPDRGWGSLAGHLQGQCTAQQVHSKKSISKIFHFSHS